MSDGFAEIINEMPKLLEELKKKPLLARDELKGIPNKGIYVFYEDNQAQYVGRSNKLKERILEHGRKSSNHYFATFAFNIAKLSMEQAIDISRYPTRDKLKDESGFKEAFYEARVKVSKMKVRVIKIEDQVKQSIFEIYAALQLNTQKYNDFSTH